MDFLTRIEKLSEQDASAGWRLAAELATPRLPGVERAAFAVRLGGVHADGVLTGEWPAVAGAATADHLILTVAPDDPMVEPRAVVLPAASARIGPARTDGGLRDADLRDVTVTGLRISVDDLIDPYGPHTALTTGAGLPMASAWLLGRAAVALGVAAGAAGDFLTGVRHRTRPGQPVRTGEHASGQRDVLRAMTAVRAARLLLHAEAGADVVNRPAAASAALHAQRAAQELVRLVFTRSGGSALYVGHPLELRRRDSEEIACHGFGEDTERAVAAAMFGVYVPTHVC